MTDSSARFSVPISARPRGARLLTAFSPTLERAVRAFDHHGLWQWVRLETDPQSCCRTGGSRPAELHQVQTARRLIQVRNAPTLSQRLSGTPNPMQPFANTFVMDVMVGRH